MKPMGECGNIRARAVGHLDRSGTNVNNTGDSFMRCKGQGFGAKSRLCEAQPESQLAPQPLAKAAFSSARQTAPAE